ncbi:MAG: NAD(P)/FAD-dependent oxidoreductase [Candidatus Paceibacterota bacterium]
MNVLIVGAGPTGLTVALELVRQGITPEIVDAKDAPDWRSRAVVVLPRSIEILNRTGVGDRLVEEGVRITKARIHRGEKPLVDLDISELLDDSYFLLGLAQDRTETLMSEELERRGVSVSYGTEVTSVETADESATVTFADGSVKTYDWVVGADGVFSQVRESLGISFDGYELEEEWSIADVELNTAAEDDRIQAWLFAGGRSTRDGLVMVPIEEKRLRLVSSTSDSVAALPLELDIKETRRSGTFKISVRNASSYVRGRAVLAGDAAHAFSPVGGRGMNLGIEDAQALAHAILTGTIAQYEVERKAKATKITHSTERARKLIVSNNPFVVFGIHVVSWLIRHSRFLQKRFVRNMVRL